MATLHGSNVLWLLFLLWIMFFTTIGNVLVCLAILKSRKLRTSSNILIVNMAFGDILLSLSTLPLAIIFLCYRVDWPLGKAGNIAFDAIWFAFTISSFVNVAIIALERYIAITKPFYYKTSVTKQRVVMGCLFLWLYVAIFILGLTFTFKKPDGERYRFLIPASVYYPVLTLHAALAFLLVPVLYAKIFLIARRHKRNIDRYTMKSQNNLHLQMKATRTIGLVLLLFIIVWLPFLISQFVEFQNVSNGEWTIGCTVVTYISYCNAPVNIFVYSYRNREIRKALLKALPLSNYCKVYSNNNSDDIHLKFMVETH